MVLSGVVNAVGQFIQNILKGLQILQITVMIRVIKYFVEELNIVTGISETLVVFY